MSRQEQAVLLVMLVFASGGATGFIPHRIELQKTTKDILLFPQVLTADPGTHVVLVTDFGADPTGQNDSTASLQMAIDRAFNLSSSSTLINGISDLGSVQLHLQGGHYLISNPLRFPAKGGGNLVMFGGSIRAAPTFPTDGFLVQLLSSALKYPYEYITFRDIMLDCGFRGGGLQVSSCLRITIQNLYVIHFSSDSIGILIQRGHESYISNTFVGQHITAGGDPAERTFGGVGISIAGNDNVVSNCVVFSAAIGILVTGQANLLLGNHLYNKATAFGGVGIKIQLPGLTQTRIVACYLDYTSIVAEAPSQLEVSDSFFLGDANVVLKATKSSSLNSVNIMNNMFSGNNKNVPIVIVDQSGGEFQSVTDILVDHNTARGMVLKATTAKATLKGNLSVWQLDLSNRLLFPSNVQHVQYSLYCPGRAFPRHVLRSVVNNTVTIETDITVFGTMSVQVDQTSGTIGLGEQPPF